MIDLTHNHHVSWPDLAYTAWEETCTTLHLWTQVVGKIRLAFTPWLNHSWHVALYPTAQGLTTSLIPYKQRSFEIEFDFNQHQLVIRTSEGKSEKIALKPRTVAGFYAAVTGKSCNLHRDTQARQRGDHGPPSATTTHTAPMILNMRTASGVR
jgi:Family of unknown function (DUF5996)